MTLNPYHINGKWQSDWAAADLMILQTLAARSSALIYAIQHQYGGHILQTLIEDIQKLECELKGCSPAATLAVSGMVQMIGDIQQTEMWQPDAIRCLQLARSAFVIAFIPLAELAVQNSHQHEREVVA